MKFFNTAGPVDLSDHYALPPLSRLDLDELCLLIRQKKYFVLHAPRQTGKTSLLLALMQYLNSRQDYTCLYANIETAQTARSNVEQGIFEVIRAIAVRKPYPTIPMMPPAPPKTHQYLAAQ